MSKNPDMGKNQNRKNPGFWPSSAPTYQELVSLCTGTSLSLSIYIYMPCREAAGSFLQNIKAFCHIAHDGTLHLANKLEIGVFSKHWTLTAKTHVKSNCLPET